MESDYNFGDKTILVAENDDTNFIFYREAFRKTGADVIWAKNGSQAVEIIRTNPKVDLVLMDIQMPIMNGYEATRQIKKLRDIPVIVLTAYAMKSVKEESEKAHCDAFVTKPIKSKDLLEVIRKYL